MKLKIILSSLIAVLVLLIAAGAYWWLWRPQTIVLSDGSQLTLLAVTYGKHHTFPKGKTPRGRKLQNSGSVTTTNDSLCVWIEQKHEQNNWPNYQLLVYDSANTACAGDTTRTYANFRGNRQGDEVMGIVFEAFPRHGSKIYLRIQEWNNRNGHQDISPNRFVISNPARGSFPRWAPDKLPNSQQDGDLQVTLNRCESAANAFNYFGRDTSSKDPMTRGVLTDFHVEQNGILVTNWQPVRIVTSDATGNSAANRGTSAHSEGDDEILTYQWGLWPEEPAWKLRVEMSRNSGYTADEMWTASAVPLTNGNMNDLFQYQNNRKPAKAAAETTLGDTKVKIFPVIHFAGDQARHYGDMEGAFRILTEPAPEGMRLNIIKITDDQDRPIKFRDWGYGGTEHRFALLKMNDDAKSINISLALHRSRYVEYTVKPPN